MKESQERWQNSGEQREQCWRDFQAAAEAAAAGNYKPAMELVTAHPCVRSELKAFTKAIIEGRLKKDAAGHWTSERTPA